MTVTNLYSVAVEKNQFLEGALEFFQFNSETVNTTTAVPVGSSLVLTNSMLLIWPRCR